MYSYSIVESIVIHKMYKKKVLGYVDSFQVWRIINFYEYFGKLFV